MTSFALSVLRKVAQTQINVITREQVLSSGLRGKRNEIPGGLWVANSLECGSLKVSVNDVVWKSRFEMGKVKACVADVDNNLFLSVAVLDFIADVSQHSDSFRLTDREQIWNANAVSHPACWYAAADLWVVVY
jgi:hypothetical protein